MRIDPNISTSAIQRYENAVKKTVPTADPGTLNQADRVELSEQGKQLASLIKAAKAAEDMDAAKVSAVIEQIKSGSYHPDPDAISEKMIDQIGLDRLI